MKWLWTWGGRCFGYKDEDNLWTHDGKHVGKFHGDEVFDKNGFYLGELKDYNRLISKLNKKNRRKSRFNPSIKRVSSVKRVNRVGRIMRIGYEDFPEI